MLSEPLQNCLCGSGQTFTTCCEKHITKTAYPETPEQLMRSRYTAYVLKNEEYLLNSWHESTRPDSLNIQNDATQWNKLKVISAINDKVHFVAFFTEVINNKEQALCLSEESIFVKNTHWTYLEGKELKTIKLTKNMSCPCQSGKKYKRCCATEI